ncbi:hypothetical protein Vi05172_g4948 [Venturia inaequalis]|nr:hypothetical protein Vi05172_g4948 [Venturia inaequalis]
MDFISSNNRRDARIDFPESEMKVQQKKTKDLEDERRIEKKEKANEKAINKKKFSFMENQFALIGKKHLEDWTRR